MYTVGCYSSACTLYDATVVQYMYIVCDYPLRFLLYACLQLIEMVGSLLERPVIHQDFRHNYPLLVSMFSEELDQAKIIFDTQLALAQTPQGMYRIASFPDLRVSFFVTELVTARKVHVLTCRKQCAQKMYMKSECFVTSFCNGGHHLFASFSYLQNEHKPTFTCVYMWPG